MNPSIILAGQTPDFLGTIDRANTAAARQNSFQRENALAQMMQEYGPGIVSGDQNAINALARFDPQAALGVQNTRLGMDATRQRMKAMSDQEERAAAQYAQGLSDREAAARAAKIEEGVKMGMSARSAQEWDAIMSRVSPELVGMYDQRDMVANKYMSMAEILKSRAGADGTKGAPTGYMWNDPNDQSKGVSPIPGYEAKPADDYQRYSQEERQAGRSPLSRLEFEQAKKGKGFTVKMPDGTEVSYGGASGTGDATVGDVYNPNEVNGVLDLIGSIKNDPSLSRVTGTIEGGGGNDINSMGSARRMYYGPEGTALVEKIGQLESNAWLSARSMLKGGGPITDYESRKAEAAVARLSRAKGTDEFVAALEELESAIRDGMAKLEKAGGAQQSQNVGGTTQGGVSWSIEE